MWNSFCWHFVYLLYYTKTPGSIKLCHFLSNRWQFKLFFSLRKNAGQLNILILRDRMRMYVHLSNHDKSKWWKKNVHRGKKNLQDCRRVINNISWIIAVYLSVIENGGTGARGVRQLYIIVWLSRAWNVASQQSASICDEKWGDVKTRVEK